MRSEFIPVSKPTIQPRDLRAVEAAMRTNWLSMGPLVDKFEHQLAEMYRFSHAVAVSSCTAALFLSLKALGVEGEVGVPALTFPATAHAALHAGCHVRLLDVDPRTWLLNPSASNISGLAAIIPVDLYGNLVPRKLIFDWKKCGLRVIEDAAHAIGATGLSVSQADTVCLSFYATKNITTLGEGGAVLTDNAPVADYIRRMRNHGLSSSAWSRSAVGAPLYACTGPGWKMNMTDPQAAMGIEQLKRLDRWRARRWELASRYHSFLVPSMGKDNLPTWDCGIPHLYPILLPEGTDRRAVIEKMREQGIGLGVHYESLTGLCGAHPEVGWSSCSNALHIGRRVVSLPLYPTLTNAQQNRVVEAFLREVGE